MTDFSAFYVTPSPHSGTTTWALSTTQVHSGTYSFSATISGANAAGSLTNNTNHRGYPTIQLQKSGGAYRSPVLINLWVYLSATIASGQWFSFATLVSDPSDSWNRTWLFNLNDQGYLQLMHVPYQGFSNLIYQRTDIPFPQNQWVKLTMYIDLTPDAYTPVQTIRGYALAYQNDVLVSAARVSGGNGYLTQAHFGLYASPEMTSGTVYNDDLTIQEMAPTRTLP